MKSDARVSHGTKADFIKEAMGFINDVNSKEIASQRWIDSWSFAFKQLINQVQYNDPEWIRGYDKKPNKGEYVEVMVYDDHADYPSINVDFAWWSGRDWIAHDDFVYGEVVLWKPLSKPLPVAEVRKIMEFKDK